MLADLNDKPEKFRIAIGEKLLPHLSTIYHSSSLPASSQLNRVIYKTNFGDLFLVTAVEQQRTRGKLSISESTIEGLIKASFTVEKGDESIAIKGTW